MFQATFRQDCWISTLLFIEVPDDCLEYWYIVCVWKESQILQAPNANIENLSIWVGATRNFEKPNLENNLDCVQSLWGLSHHYI